MKIRPVLVALFVGLIALPAAAFDSTPTIVKSSHDTNGRLIQQIDDQGYVINYVYGKNGKSFIKTYAMTTDPQVLANLAAKEQGLLAKINQTTNPGKRGDIAEDLAFLYAHELQQPQKALALIPLLTDRQEVFNVQAHVIEGDFTTTDMQKIEALKGLSQEFPEQQKLIDTLISISQTNLDKLNQD